MRPRERLCGGKRRWGIGKSTVLGGFWKGEIDEYWVGFEREEWVLRERKKREKNWWPPW
jgi:hypothetical protein